MTEITDLREIQLLELGILQHLADICRKHGIRFFLSNGTLLGAVKYEKFIPWDDDVDILMPRADYDRLMHLPDIDTTCYRLFSQERMPAWRLPFAKLCDMRTEKRETSANFGLPTGLDIDIFPIDVWSGGERQARRCGLWRRGVSAAVEEEFTTPRTGWRRLVLHTFWCISHCLGSRFFCQRIASEVRHGQEAKKPVYVGCVVWSLYGRRELLAAEVFLDKTEVMFEGKRYPAPVGYDRYLSSLYGNYRPDPPPEKQISHHHFRVWYR